ncbi:hypothetical protein BDN71DRAFT_1369121, partial [Pleurotus eryngii]
VVAEFVPIDFRPDDQGELRMLKQDTGMQGSMREALYIKPAHKRMMGQEYAHLKLNIFIRGKMISVRKNEHNSPMCYWCHTVSDRHFAANCTAEVELCGHCGSEHRSRECS